MKRALITGSAGFIGRHMVKTLHLAGYETVGIDVAHAGRDARDLFRHELDHFDVVIHAAAVVGGRSVIESNPLAHAVNLELDAALFQWARRACPGRVVYLSSSAVYPTWLQGTNVPSFINWYPTPTTISSSHYPVTYSVTTNYNVPRSLTESDRSTISSGDPDELYGWCKLTGEKLAELAQADGVRVSIARPFSGYGEDQSTDYPFPAFARRARERQDPFVMWGDGRQVRDWIHVDDICAALLVMVHEGIDGPVNLGSGEPVSMRELAEKMCTTAGYEPVFSALIDKPSGVSYRVADVTVMRKFYEPRVSLDEGVARALSWETT